MATPGENTLMSDQSSHHTPPANGGHSRPAEFGLRLLLALTLLLLPSQVFGQGDGVPALPAEGIEAATVRVDGYDLFPVRGISAYPATRRARDIQARIAAIASDPSISVEELKAVSGADREQIFAGETMILAVVDADAELAGIERRLLAEVYLGRIREAIETYRRDRSPQVLLINSGYVLAATIILALVAVGLRAAFRRLEIAIAHRYGWRIDGLKVKSVELLDAEQIWTAVRGALKLAHALLLLSAVYWYLNFALSLLPWTRKLSYGLLHMVLDPVRAIGTGLLTYTDNVIFLVILFFIVRYVLRLLRGFFSAVRKGKVTFASFEPEWAWPTYRIIRLLVIVFAIVVAYPYIPGSDSEAFKGISIFLGVLFSLGSSSVISNIIAGYTMTYRRAFKVGDRVKIGETVGDVAEMRLLVTHLRSLKNEEVVIPNSTILNNEVVNYSSLAREDGLILHTTVGIGYEIPWRQVEAMLLLAAERTGGLLKDPQPFVLQKSLGDFAVNYELNAYCTTPRRTMSLYNALHQNIQDVFNEYGVQIMTPAYERDTEQPKVVPKDQWYAPPAQPPAPEKQGS